MLRRILTISGWLLVAAAVGMVAFGILYGKTEYHAFYQRIEDYHAQDSTREEMGERRDSLYALYTDMEEQGDTVAVAAIGAQIESLESSEDYMDLFGTPPPPEGFSLAGVVTIVLFILSFLPLGVGVLLVAIGRNVTNKKKNIEQ